MISERKFKLNVPSRLFCRNPELIENYDKAIADTTQIWVCHHRLETHNSDGERRLVDLTVEELKALGMYYDRPPKELIFLTHTEHSKLHKPHLGKTHSKEARLKMSKGMKGKHHSEEWKRRMSELIKGKHWKLVDGRRVYY